MYHVMTMLVMTKIETLVIMTIIGMHDVLCECKRDDHATCMSYNCNDNIIAIDSNDWFVALCSISSSDNENNNNEVESMNMDLSQVTNSSHVSGPGSVSDIVTSNNNKSIITSNNKIECVPFSTNSFYL